MAGAEMLLQGSDMGGQLDSSPSSRRTQRRASSSAGRRAERAMGSLFSFNPYSLFGAGDGDGDAPVLSRSPDVPLPSVDVSGGTSGEVGGVGVASSRPTVRSLPLRLDARMLSEQSAMMLLSPSPGPVGVGAAAPPASSSGATTTTEARKHVALGRQSGNGPTAQGSAGGGAPSSPHAADGSLHPPGSPNASTQGKDLTSLLKVALDRHSEALKALPPPAVGDGGAARPRSLDLRTLQRASRAAASPGGVLFSTGNMPHGDARARRRRASAPPAAIAPPAMLARASPPRGSARPPPAPAASSATASQRSFAAVLSGASASVSRDLTGARRSSDASSDDGGFVFTTSSIDGDSTDGGESLKSVEAVQSAVAAMTAFEPMWTALVAKMAPFAPYYRMGLTAVPPPREERALLAQEGCPLCLSGVASDSSPLVLLGCVDQSCEHLCHIECLASGFWPHRLYITHPPLVMSARAAVMATPPVVDRTRLEPGPQGKCYLELSIFHIVSEGRMLLVQCPTVTAFTDESGRTFLLAEGAEVAVTGPPLDESDRTLRARRGRVVCTCYSYATGNQWAHAGHVDMTYVEPDAGGDTRGAANETTGSGERRASSGGATGSSGSQGRSAGGAPPTTAAGPKAGSISTGSVGSNDARVELVGPEQVAVLRFTHGDAHNVLELRLSPVGTDGFRVTSVRYEFDDAAPSPLPSPALDLNTPHTARGGGAFFFPPGAPPAREPHTESQGSSALADEAVSTSAATTVASTSDDGSRAAATAAQAAAHAQARAQAQAQAQAQVQAQAHAQAQARAQAHAHAQAAAAAAAAGVPHIGGAGMLPVGGTGYYTDAASAVAVAQWEAHRAAAASAAAGYGSAMAPYGSLAAGFLTQGAPGSTVLTSVPAQTHVTAAAPAWHGWSPESHPGEFADGASVGPGGGPATNPGRGGGPSNVTGRGSDRGGRRSGGHGVSAPDHSVPIAHIAAATNFADLAKSQPGSKYLQARLRMEGAAGVELVLPTVLPDIGGIIRDMFGNYFSQALVRAADNTQRTAILQALAPTVADVSCNRNGTYALQSIVDLIDPAQADQVAALREGLAPHALRVMCHEHGTHVMQRFQRRFGPGACGWIFDVARASAQHMATSPHGVTVLATCVDTAPDELRAQLVHGVLERILELAHHSYGNYIVQHMLGGKRGRRGARDRASGSSSPVLVAEFSDSVEKGTERRIDEAEAALARGTWLPVMASGQPLMCEAVCRRLRGHFRHMARQKYSSNVVERCAVVGGSQRRHLLEELFAAPGLGELLTDDYANYAVQTCLQHAPVAERARLVALVRPHLAVFSGPSTPASVLSKWTTLLDRLESGAAPQAGSAPSGIEYDASGAAGGAGHERGGHDERARDGRSRRGRGNRRRGRGGNGNRRSGGGRR